MYIVVAILVAILISDRGQHRWPIYLLLVAAILRIGWGFARR
jgi:cytochrome b